MTDDVLKHCAKHNDGEHRFGERLLYMTYAKCECGVRRDEKNRSLLPPILEKAKAPDKLAAAMEALVLLVTAKRLHDAMEANPVYGAESAVEYKDLKSRGWALAFELVDEHKLL